MKRYTIRITEQTEERKICGHEWKVGGTEGVKNPSSDKYGYTPEIEKTVVVTREIFMQDKDGLDLVAVIKSLNGLP